MCGKRRSIHAALAILLALGGLTIVSGPATAAVPVAGGTYQINVLNSGKCMEVQSGTTDMFSQAQQWDCTGAAWQQWRLAASGSDAYQIVNNATGMCLSNKDAGQDNGVAIVQETCTANTNEQRRFTQANQWANTPDGFAGAAGTTGGAGGQTVTVTTQADLERYASAAEPYTIRVGAAITVSPYGREIPVKSNKTVIGAGTSGQIVNGGFFLGEGTSNVIIRNLTIRDTRVASDDPDDKDFDYDGIQMDTANKIWIDHNVKNPYYPDTTAELRQSGSIVTGSSGRQETRGSAFDPRSFYSYTLDPAANVPALLRAGAGPQAGIA